MINYDDHPDSIRKIVRVTEFRQRMSHYIAMVRYGDDWVCIKRRGTDPVYLVSQADFDLINRRRDRLLNAPKDPDTGKPKGKGLWQQLRDALAADRRGR